MAEIQRKEFFIIIILVIWFDDIFLVIRIVQPQWAFNLYGIYYEKMNNGILIPYEMG